jgi:hypothetical protein
MMKKSIILSGTFLLALTLFSMLPQTSVAGGKATNEEKIELKLERKALREAALNNVSMASKNSFYEEYGDVKDVVWQKTQNFDEATFTLNGQKMTAYFNADAFLVGTTSARSFDELPGKSQSKIKSLYPDYKIARVFYFDNQSADASELLIDGMPLNDEDNYFVELKKDSHKIILKVDPLGETSFFKQI